MLLSFITAIKKILRDEKYILFILSMLQQTPMLKYDSDVDIENLFAMRNLRENRWFNIKTYSKERVYDD